jgi:dTDP-4-amino-4,6-dideoxygalactose transaminase
VKPGDEVICQSFTFAASANPVTYVGAKPVFIDSEPDTWNMDPQLLEQAITDHYQQTGKYPKEVIPVHLCGMPAKMDEIMTICSRYNIPVMEDAAEAIGAEYNRQKCGTFGEPGVLSFNGNRTSEKLFNDGLCLPSGPNLTDQDINRVVKSIIE